MDVMYVILGAFKELVKDLLMLNLDIMDMDTDTVAMEVMDMVVDMVMVMDTVTMARFFEKKIAYSCCSKRNQKCLYKVHKIE